MPCPSPQKLAARARHYWGGSSEKKSGDSGKRKRPTNRWASKYWCWLQDLNPPPPDYKSGALPDELSQQKTACYFNLFNSGEYRIPAFFGWPWLIIRFFFTVRSGLVRGWYRTQTCRRHGCRRFEGHALSVFTRVNRDDPVDRDRNIARNSAETRAETDDIIVYHEATGGFEADI